ncbi:hypothetical protein [Streptomyces albireticuli]|uniref:Uncharacterized protein n=1 Tax=Streptomyces albireticuli TaxID=1940 RepID=A0A2A2D2A3_9ACTN|nr:hypothetical protein [Streptomyces albireticuli]MCD9145680.1 hypothetical protein [Streptomyces albireticuli]MCD9165588.1 hypothetical protein [Streptomyces albireticuli]MCD9195889.1 hypothetical protein [Streptomyces albireticuli]PAU46618.1 hypothetical protein CK936_23155 [Streptomyces albireticuli]
MTGRRGEDPPGRGKAVPRDMQDQQAGTLPEPGPTGPGTPRLPEDTETAEIPEIPEIPEDAEDVGGTAGTGEPRGDQDEPPD